MMKLFSMLLVLASLMAPMANAEAPVSKQVQVGVNNVFVPGGFGPDSDAFVIVSGIFQNSCYKWSHADIANVTDKVHEIRTYADVAQTMCLMVLVPYSQEVRLGRMTSGEHTLRFLSGDGTYFERTMVVE